MSGSKSEESSFCCEARGFWTRQVTKLRVAWQHISKNKDHLDMCPVYPCLASPSVFITKPESSCTFALIALLESSPAFWPWHEINPITKAYSGLQDCILGMIIHADLTTSCATVFRPSRNMEKINGKLDKNGLQVMYWSRTIVSASHIDMHAA